jgi:hypothetical protein
MKPLEPCPICGQPTHIIKEGNYEWDTCNRQCIKKIHGFKLAVTLFDLIKQWNIRRYRISCTVSKGN